MKENQSLPLFPLPLSSFPTTVPLPPLSACYLRFYSQRNSHLQPANSCLRSRENISSMVYGEEKRKKNTSLTSHKSRFIHAFLFYTSLKKEREPSLEANEAAFAAERGLSLLLHCSRRFRKITPRPASLHISNCELELWAFARGQPLCHAAGPLPGKRNLFLKRKKFPYLFTHPVSL